MADTDDMVVLERDLRATRKLLKDLLCDYVSCAVAPRIRALAQPLVAMQGAILNMDFSA